MNKCIFTGNLGAAPEVRYMENGDAVASFNLGVTERWKNKAGEKQESTEWIKCVAWRKLGEICAEYLDKGSKVMVIGKQKTRSYDDKDGVKRYIVECVLDEMEMLGAKSGGSQEESKPAAHPPGAAQNKRPAASGTASGRSESLVIDDEIPF